MTDGMDPEIAALVARHQREDAERKRESTMRLLFTILLSILVFLTVLWLPPYAAYIFALTGALFVGWSLWELRPGRCQICSRRAIIPFSKNPGPQKRRPWWDIRSPSRKDLVWVCTDHFELYLNRRIHPIT